MRPAPAASGSTSIPRSTRSFGGQGNLPATSITKEYLMAQHGYLREYDEGWDRGDDRERGDRNPDERTGDRNRGFMFEDRNGAITTVAPLVRRETARASALLTTIGNGAQRTATTGAAAHQIEAQATAIANGRRAASAAIRTTIIAAGATGRSRRSIAITRLIAASGSSSSIPTSTTGAATAVRASSRRSETALPKR